jgi:hypothetical protein
MRGMLPCTPCQVDTKPDDAAREPRFGPLFLESTDLRIKDFRIDDSESVET